MSIEFLAHWITARLGAMPQPDLPARATFDGGVIVLGVNELGVMFEGVGALFVSVVAEQIVVEAAALNSNEPRAVVQARHAELERRGRQIFGDTIEPHDPLGVRGGRRASWS